MGGAGMCVHQAAETFKLFTGIPADTQRLQRTFAVRPRLGKSRCKRVQTGREMVHETSVASRLVEGHEGRNFRSCSRHARRD